ncbi:adenylate/guanylate cyclase domain-containing protein [Aquimarina pacifica]|uniref:adenylate/guanylate cyclase domain-containing protein n=1 Tax=Aquimarina pacifica TaxID=1296415 RepID=UPI00046F2032|nr:adenylate/guanylate cyclase domain-containing protein [Aquimarina pacifica]
MLSPKQKRNIGRILPFGIIWLLFGLIFLAVEYAATKNFGYTAEGVIKVDYKVFIFAVWAITIVGLLIGVIELLFLHRFFSKSSFSQKIIGKLIIYAAFLFLIVCIAYPIAASIELETSVFDKVVWDKFLYYLNSITFLSTAFQMSVSLGVTLLYAEISENIGHGILINFVSGKYHRPKEENRIFMFLDMKSSTAIAEKLGHIKYFEFLKEYYYSLSDAMIEYSGEIYQYVGDEMVVSWKQKKGIKNTNCLHCFFAMKEALKRKEDEFIKNFGICPTFKAGFHYGAVTTGEIGSVKKEIIFTGDVLNATARIQGLCNQYQVDILISGDLYKILKLGPDFKVKPLGKTELRGKSTLIELYTTNLSES